jgi:hypothetical protein
LNSGIDLEMVVESGDDWGTDAMSKLVLVHGSYQGGWVWQRVATRFRDAGHTVYAPTLK